MKMMVRTMMVKFIPEGKPDGDQGQSTEGPRGGRERSKWWWRRWQRWRWRSWWRWRLGEG